MCAPSIPKPPDPARTAAVQGTINNETAYLQNRLNMTNQTTPYGSLTYQPTGEDFTYNRFNQALYDVHATKARNEGRSMPPPEASIFNNTVSLGPRYEAVTTLTPEGEAMQQGQIDLQQGMLDTGNAQLQRVSDALGQPLDFGGIRPFRGSTPGIADSGDITRMSEDAAPDLSGSFDAGAPMRGAEGIRAPSLQSDLGRAGLVRSVGPAGDLATEFDTGRAIQGAGPSAAQASGTIAPSGRISRLDDDYAPQISGQFRQGRGVQFSGSPAQSAIGTVAPSGGIQGRVGADDFGDDRMRVEQALMDRMQPYLDQRRESEQARLANMGFTDRSSEGYQRAIDDVNRQENDARLGAIINAGGEQSRLFGMDLAAGQFGNQAQAQRFGQNAAATDIANRAIQQDYTNRLAGAGFNNAAAGQEFNQNLAARDFANNAALQRLGAEATAAGFNNQAQAQEFSQNVTANNVGNAAIQQNYENQLAAAGFNNQAAGQEFAQGMAAAGFGNQAENQAFQNRAMQTAANNQAQAQRFDQNAQRAAFANAAGQQGMQNALALRDFSNQANSAQFGQNLAAEDFANQAAQQGFANQQAIAGFNNQAQAQQFGQNTTIAQDGYNQAALNNAARQQAIQERLLLRQTPLNEISAIASGTQVQQPNFVNTPQAQIQAPDYQGAVYASYQGDVARAQQEAQQQQALTQGLFSLGGAALGGFGATNGFGFFPSFGG